MIGEAEYYERQVRLPEVGLEGQAKLRAAKVLVVGAGGLGCPVLSYLAAAGVGTIGICEGDRLEASNLHRQTLYPHAGVGQGKAGLAERRLREQNPFVSVTVHADKLSPGNILEIFRAYDLVVDCTDNFPTKFMINDAAVLTGTPAVFASIYQYEGQLMFVCPPLGGPCMRCLWPEMPEPGCVGSCAEVGVLGVVPGILGCMQAMEAIKYLLGLPAPLHDAMVIVDCLSYATQRVKIPRHTSCPVCGTHPRITGIEAREYFPQAGTAVDVRALDDAALAVYRIFDIREQDEVDAQPLPGVSHQHLAMSVWDLDTPPIGKDEMCLLCCARGMRSERLATQLRERGFARVYSATDGWKAFYERTKTWPK